MILGVDHVALSCEDIDLAAAALAAHGFAIQFLEKNLHNAPEKVPLLRKYEPTHAIAYAQSSQGIVIELTQHDVPARSATPYKVLFRGHPPLSATPCDDVWNASFEARGLWLDDLQTPAWFAPDDESWSVQRVGLDVRDERTALAFWTMGLGARRATARSSHPCVSFVSPVPRWSLSVVLRPGHAIEMPRLDDSGFPCLALLTSQLEQDVKRACAHGGHSPTAPFVLTVNGRPLKVGLLRGPSDELIELIEIQRK